MLPLRFAPLLPYGQPLSLRSAVQYRPHVQMQRCAFIVCKQLAGESEALA
jgi:hypothetical protein